MSLSAHSLVNALLGRCLGLGFLCLCFAAGAQDQLQTRPLENLGSLNASVRMPTCLPSGLTNDDSNLLVVNLPAIDALALRDNVYSPVTPVVLSGPADNPDNCINPLSQNLTLVFDPSLAVMAPNTGLLRNMAKQNPAANVLVQLGLVNAQGIFTPVDLRQPLRLNTGLAQSTGVALVLGVRYVAAKAVLPPQNQELSAAALSPEVIPGQVQVQLPFVMKVH